MSDPRDNQPEIPDTLEDDEAVREYGRQMALDSLLRDALGNEASGGNARVKANGSSEKSNIISPPASTFPRPGLKVALLAAAACIAGFVGWSIWNSGMIDGGPDPYATLDKRWILEPQEGADYTIAGPNLVKLHSGELLFTSVDDAELTVETPYGTAVAEGTKFYIGHHSHPNDDTTTPKTDNTMKPNAITRILVLAGVVTMTTSGGSVKASEKETVLVADPDAVPVKIAVEANTRFAINLYKQLASENTGKSMFFSPYSVSNALGMTAEGARGKTAEEMGEVLGLPVELQQIGPGAQRIPWEFGKLHLGMGMLNSRYNAKDKPYSLSVANAIWGEESYPFSGDFADTLKNAYGINALQKVSFKGDPEGNREKMNAWVEKQTQERIKNLFPEGSVTSATRMVLANAVYFKADWLEPFDANFTRSRDFTQSNGKTVEATIMVNTLEMGKYAAFNPDGTFFTTPIKTDPSIKESGYYPARGGFAMAELPYKGNEISMIVIAPDSYNGLEKLEDMLTVENLRKWISQLKSRKLTISLPKFKSETGYSMAPTLAAMGMPSAFGSTANFDGMREGESNAEIFISQVIHKAFVKVDELGTEAAAATGVIADGGGINPDFTPYLNADRPFVYVIKDNRTGSILFIGRMMNPAE